MFAIFNRFEVQMTLDQAQSASHQGQCDADVLAMSQVPAIIRQLRKIKPADIRAELRGYGAWDETELADDEENRQRIIWIAAGNICEDQFERESAVSGR